jgi:hypothetical protein
LDGRSGWGFVEVGRESEEVPGDETAFPSMETEMSFVGEMGVEDSDSVVAPWEEGE